MITIKSIYIDAAILTVSFTGACLIAQGIYLSTRVDDPITIDVPAISIEVDMALTPTTYPIAEPPSLPPIERPIIPLIMSHPDTTPEELAEINCLALNLYHEARGSTFRDKVGVSYVVLNRVGRARYPNTVCEVVYQRNQFSWTGDRISDTAYEQDAWVESLIIAEAVYNGRVLDPTGNATHYHATYVNPRWSRYGYDVRLIGAHQYMKVRRP